MTLLQDLNLVPKRSKLFFHRLKMRTSMMTLLLLFLVSDFFFFYLLLNIFKLNDELKI